MRDGLALGARRQCVYTLAGYDAYLANQSGFAKLFGIVRDLGATERFRPAGLAIAMLNQAVAGDLARSTNLNSVQDVSLYAFLSDTGWSAAIVSSAPVERAVSISFPPARTNSLPQRILKLDAR